MKAQNLCVYSGLSLLSVAFTIGMLQTAQALAVPVRAGTTGSEVVGIQRCLQRLGYFTGPVTGKFGNLTTSAVAKFQQANGLPPVGYVGFQTQRILQAKCYGRTIASNHIRHNSINYNYNNGYNNGELRLGSRGAAVSKLQQDLQILRLYNGAITGYFDSDTQRAVIQFQQTYGLPTDGVVGTRTQDTLRTALNASAGYNDGYNNNSGIGGDSLPNALDIGSRGQLVSQLQQDLHRLGYFNSNPTGYFGYTTRDSVLRFQQEHQIPPSGIADTQTLAAISGTSQGSYVSSSGCLGQSGNICEGERSQRVILVQRSLGYRGFFRGNITGYFGSATREAVTQFQQYSRLNSTGIVDFKTWEALGLTNNDNQFHQQNQYHYTVVVPKKNQETVYKVRQFVPNACEAKSSLGHYVNAGGFRERGQAEEHSNFLRSHGLDARVAYIEPVCTN